MLLQNRNIVVSLPVLRKSQESERAGAVTRFNAVREKIAHFQETGEVRAPRRGEWYLAFGIPAKASEEQYYYQHAGAIQPILKPGRELTFADFHIRENNWGIWELLVAGEQIATSTHERPLTALAGELQKSLSEPHVVCEEHIDVVGDDCETCAKEWKQQTSSIYYVDIPTLACIEDDEGAFKNVGQFPTKTEAIAFAREHFGADEEGRVCLVSG